jgi:hypothetical protein
MIAVQKPVASIAVDYHKKVCGIRHWTDLHKLQAGQSGKGAAAQLRQLIVVQAPAAACKEFVS